MDKTSLCILLIIFVSSFDIVSDLKSISLLVKKVISKFRNDDFISTFEFKDKNDIVRNPLITKILQKYDNETEWKSV